MSRIRIHDYGIAFVRKRIPGVLLYNQLFLGNEKCISNIPNREYLEN